MFVDLSPSPQKQLDFPEPVLFTQKPSRNNKEMGCNWPFCQAESEALRSPWFLWVILKKSARFPTDASAMDNIFRGISFFMINLLEIF